MSFSHGSHRRGRHQAAQHGFNALSVARSVPHVSAEEWALDEQDSEECHASWVSKTQEYDWLLMGEGAYEARPVPTVHAVARALGVKNDLDSPFRVVPCSYVPLGSEDGQPVQALLMRLTVGDPRVGKEHTRLYMHFVPEAGAFDPWVVQATQYGVDPDARNISMFYCRNETPTQPGAEGVAGPDYGSAT